MRWHCRRPSPNPRPPRERLCPLRRLARTSRTRVTAMMNRNTKDISTDLLLRVLYSLGYTAKIKFQKAA